MVKEAELFKAAQNGNIAMLERAFANHLKRLTGVLSHHGSSLGSIRCKLHPNIQDNAGCTLLHHAILNGHKDAVALLLKCAASTSITDDSGSAPLHLAAWKGDLEVVKMLVTMGPSYANVNQQNDSDDAALHLASQYGYSLVVEFLLQRHADPLLHNLRDETPLDLAAQYGHLSCVHFLISYSPETLRPTVRGFSPLHLAARNGHSIVALSLINAGISVNTVRDHGSALHEAALCGKIDMVELLLDKGVDYNLKNAEGCTVMDILEQFTANQATEIRRKIQLHIDDQRRSRSHSQRNPTSRVIAVAKTTSQPLVEGSSALAFSTGDHISVMRASGGGVYVGSVWGKSGSFLAEDVIFYKEVDDQLVSTVECDLHMIPGHTHAINHSCDATPTISKSPPGVALLEKLVEEDPPEVTAPLTHPDNDFDTTDISLPDVPNNACLHEDEGCPPATTKSSNVETIAATSKPSSRTPAVMESNPDSSENTPDSVVATGTTAPHQSTEGVTRKMSKKEKRFRLSKDDGRYSELNPINPFEAKREFGDSLKLKTVDSKGVVLVSGPNDDHVGLSEEGPSVSSSIIPQLEDGAPSADVLGAYYVLEVGGFDKSPPDSGTIPISNISGMERLNLESHSGSTIGKEAQPLPGENGYFMLNEDDSSLTISGKDNDGDRELYSVVSSQRRVCYENISVPESYGMTGSGSRDGNSCCNGASQLHPHLVVADSDEGQVSFSGVCLDATTSTLYANVATPTNSNASLSTATGFNNVTKSTNQERLQGSYDLYENTQPNLVLSPPTDTNSTPNPTPTPPDTSSTPNSTPTANTTALDRPGMKCSAKQRSDVYEVVPMQDQPIKEPDVGVSDCQHNPTSSENELLESNIFEASGDNPFAGLVMTDSQHRLGGMTTVPFSLSSAGEGLPGREKRVELWDSMKVEQEWSQVDSLLRDVRGSFGSLPFSVPSASTTNPTCEVSAWLKSEGLVRYSGILQVHGFDNLRFLGGRILSMDDMVDIGIISVDDQYNLMAAVSLLAPPPSVGHASTVVEWLGLLDLLLLETKFDNYTLNKISTLWDVQLTSVVGIELLGYRKRLQYGISELCQAHPEWGPEYAKPNSTKHISNLSPLNSPGHTLSMATKKAFFRDYRSLRSSSTSSSDLPSSPLRIREPAEAQSYAGEKKPTRTPKLPSQSWCHDNDALMKNSINYNVKYLGSIFIKKLHGSQLAAAACLKLRNSTQHMKIMLSVSWKGIKFMESQSKKIVSYHAIRDVSYCTNDIEDKSVFAYITKDRSSGKNYSHVFAAPSQEVAGDIRMTLAQAFEICYQKVMSVRLSSPERS